MPAIARKSRKLHAITRKDMLKWHRGKVNKEKKST
nr:MAG TPA: hypothetical protein [Caudoviricetes sp.]DAW24710.1 MAG TPA: hypothetical protein [Caudoviricetes sp.]